MELIKEEKILFPLKGYYKNKDYQKAKMPAVKEWQKKTGLDNKAIEHFISKNHWLGLAIKNTTVVDLDTIVNKKTGEIVQKGHDVGELVIEALRQKDLNFHAIRTPNGYQLIFNHSEGIKNNTKQVTPLGVVTDYRVKDKGYIVYPTENTEGRYFVHEAGGPLSDVPDLLQPMKKYHSNIKFLPIYPIEDGTQNDTIQRWLSEVHNFKDSDQVRDIGHVMGDYLCSPPYDSPDMLNRTIDSVLNQSKRDVSEAPEFNVIDERTGEQRDFIFNEDGSIKKLLHNLRVMILSNEKANQIRFNEFTQEITYKGVGVTDSFLDDLRLEISTQFQMNFSKDDVMQMVGSIARDRPYHPIKQIIESKDWDGVPRAETLFIDYLGADDNAYTRAVARKWLIGAVARIYEPGIKMEMVPILQGKQGIGKSTLGDKLGGDFFLDTLKSLGTNKDDYQLLIGSWIIELGELSSFNDTKIETMKGFISARVDKLRLPYNKLVQPYHRTCVFIGTTNPGQYLRDTTGNRRFFPIPLKHKPTKNVFALDKHTVQQIWAESHINYIIGENLYLDKETEEIANNYREEATEENVLLMQVDDYLEMNVPGDWNTKTPIDKRIYFDRYKHDGSEEGNSRIDKTTIEELAYILKINPKDYASNAKIKQLGLHMDSKDDWKKKYVKIRGKSKMGFMRL